MTGEGDPGFGAMHPRLLALGDSFLSSSFRYAEFVGSFSDSLLQLFIGLYRLLISSAFTTLPLPSGYCKLMCADDVKDLITPIAERG